MIEIAFIDCVMRVNHADRYIETRFADGSVAPARPNHTTDDIQRAYDLGYEGDTWEMTLDHEVMHSWVPMQMYGKPSVILTNVAYGNPNRWPEGGKPEEGYVTSMQRFLRTGIKDDLVQGFFAACRVRHPDLTAEQLTEQAKALLVQVRAEGVYAVEAA